jgi:hypothetical protein
MRINLNVPFAEKEIAKRRGALWDEVRKTWYIVNPPRLDVFVDWMPKHLLKPTQSKPLDHGLFKVTQSRTPKKKSKKTKK